jgi:hypothetical protein
MGSAIETVREPGAIRGSGGGSQYDRPGQNYIAVATVGHGPLSASNTWLVVESGQLLVEITYQTGNPGQESRARISAGMSFFELQYGEQVVVHMVGGNESHGVIVGVLNSLRQPLPATVAGIATGSAEAPQRGDQAPAHVFTFMRTRAGHLLAIESGADMLLHSGAGVEIKGNRIHLDGRVHLGEGFKAPPSPATVTTADTNDQGAGKGVNPGEDGEHYEPTNVANQTIPSYNEHEDGIVRAKDRYQSNINIDPAAFAYINTQAAYITALEVLVVGIAGSAPLAALDPSLTTKLTAFQLIPKPGTPPETFTSAAVTASKHTASDD